MLLPKARSLLTSFLDFSQNLPLPAWPLSNPSSEPICQKSPGHVPSSTLALSSSILPQHFHYSL